MTEPLKNRLAQLAETVELHLLDESDSPSSLTPDIASVLDEVRFVGADDVVDVLEGIRHHLESDSRSADDEADELLPLVFRLRDLSDEVVEIDDVPADEHEYVDLDLRPEVEEVLSLTEADERLVNAGVQSGARIFLVEIRAGTYSLDAVHDAVEARFRVVRTLRHEQPGRLTSLVVDAVEPDVRRALEERLDIKVGEIEVAVRPVEAAELRHRTIIASEWYRTLPRISVVADTSALERIWLFAGLLAPTAGEATTSGLWRDFRGALCEALTVDVPTLLAGLREPLETMARAQHRPVRIVFSGEPQPIGAEIAESLRAAVFELLSNAIVHGIETEAERINAGKRGVGTIRCIAQSRYPGLTLRVQDDGRGADEAAVRRAFSERRGGGLARARKLIQNHLGGRIGLRSSSRGTTVTLDLPAVRGVFRGVVFRRGAVDYAIPAAITAVAETIGKERVVVDRTGGRFLRYQRRVIPFVEPQPAVARYEDGEETPGAAVEHGGVHDDPSAAVVIRIAGDPIGLAADYLGEETVLVSLEDGTVHMPGDEGRRLAAVSLRDL
ncbi:MAG: ATP-binding protein [Spirochaetales bacterium]|nr:ATP-binding protein [Spirochaetales bacterium]